MSNPSTFDVCGPLPVGTTLLEASAGTGKTWTIGALVTRYVAEGVARLEELLVVTFGRAASQELRQRVREHLVGAERALSAHLQDGSAPPVGAAEQDEVVQLLLADPGQVPARVARLRQALSDFDAATIATTHQFCQLVLRSLGVAGDTDAGASLVEDLDDLLQEVVDDLYLRGFIGQSERAPEFTHAEARAIARAAAVKNPSALLEPAEAPEGSAAARRVRFAHLVRTELDRRKRRLGILSYDDLLSQLAQALQQADAPARERMRARWRIVLVDEFQDTDPVQWQVLDRAFSGVATMVLIGDPKQAIYAFRGGDVVSYLQAARAADSRHTLGTNWRTDGALVQALQVVLQGAELGDPEIVGRPVAAAHHTTRLQGAPHPDPFRLRVLTRHDLGVRGPRPARMGPVRAHLQQDVARDIAALLASGATFEGRTLRPADIAVLAPTGARLAEVRQALQTEGVPAVVAGGGSVLSSPGATDWLTLLEALEQPHRSARVRAAALTPFFGHTALELDQEGEQLTDRVARRLRHWAEIFADRGVAAVFEMATAHGLPARVLRQEEGERALTDLRHVGQELHDVALAGGLGLPALLTWLREHLNQAPGESTSARTRRLDSDAAAVQLSTVHASKGLQWPVVYLPYLSEHFVREEQIALFHSEAGDQARCLDVGGTSGPTWRASSAASRRELAGEQLRLAYVALTRAQSQVVAWWAAGGNAKDAPLHRLLLGRRPGEAAVPDSCAVPEDAAAIQALRAWEEAGGPRIERATIAAPAPAPDPEQPPRLEAARFRRTIDHHWRRTSYSSLSRLQQSSAGGVDSEAEEVPLGDEPPGPTEVTPEVGPDVTPGTSPDGPPDVDDASAPRPAPVLSPMGDLPVGATFGSLVHEVLETADPQAEDLMAELEARITEHRYHWPVEVASADLAHALVPALHSPLGPLALDRRLVDIPLPDRLAELDFELPLAGGDLRRDGPAQTDATRVLLGDLAQVLRAHLPADDPLLPYATILESQPELAAQQLRGYLTGSIDVVLRVGGRYLVVDYKTNWLGPADAVLTAQHYRPEAMAAAMGHSDYPLQALLYAVVLHRFLRWRLPDYDPPSHLGGVLYLYLRGMCGPQTPVIDGHPCGVFAWSPPTALVLELSDLLDGVKQ